MYLFDGVWRVNEPQSAVCSDDVGAAAIIR